MFESLLLKTFILLFLSLLASYITSILSARHLGKALSGGDVSKYKSLQILAIVLSFVVLFALFFVQHITPLNIIVLLIFAALIGYTMGIYSLAKGEVLRNAIGLTALTTLATGIIASRPEMDFSWMGSILSIALLVLIVAGLIRLFFKIQKGQRFFAALGVIVFTGYLLFDFNRLSKLKTVAEANNWPTAVSFAVDIYLDIINLLVSLIDLMSSSSN